MEESRFGILTGLENRSSRKGLAGSIPVSSEQGIL